MTHSASLAGYVAGNRFGLGLRPGELKQFMSDPRGWLHQQVPHVTRMPAALQGCGDSAPLLVSAVERLRNTRKAVDKAQKQRPATGEMNALAAPDNTNTRQLREAVATNETTSRQQQRDLLAARLRAALTTDDPFAERLVRFWSNHFTVAEGGQVKRTLREIAVPYENEAIRTHLGGSFADLVVAVEQHPAMLIYLDNLQSIGPSTRLGKFGKRGLNENLAREILELHTLGVDGGYTQQDVTTLARLITGWTVGGLADNRLARLLTGEPGRFHFAERLHEPGAQTLLGKRYADDGVRQGEAALRDLARHPATARHIATKLARHFVADQPPPAVISALEKTFRATDGDLPSLHAALIDTDAMWDDSHRKLKTPEELVISTGRALSLAEVMDRTPRRNANVLLQALVTFAQVPFTAPSPAGWPDSAEFWGSADALLKRIEWTSAVAERLPGGKDAVALYPELLPEEPALKQELSRAASASQALALLLGSPQFQWR